MSPHASGLVVRLRDQSQVSTATDRIQPNPCRAASANSSRAVTRPSSTGCIRSGAGASVS